MNSTDTKTCSKSKLAFVLAFACATILAQAQSARVIGRVVDRQTNEPIPFASVYFNATSIGTATDASGNFEIRNVPLGNTELVASLVGYETVSVWLQLEAGKTTTVEFKLAPDVILLSTITIKGERDEKWQKLYADFFTHFVGQTENAKQTSILNPEVIDLRYDVAEKKLTAKASQPLEIENLALGYHLTVVLEKFEVSPDFFSIQVKSFFKELEATSELQSLRWAKRRLSTFEGSERHFFGSVIKGSFQQEGFLVQKSSASHHQDIREFSNGGIISSYSAELTMKDIMLDSADGNFVLLQDGIFKVTYQGGTPRQTLSWLEINDPYLSIYRNGNVKLPANFWRLGHFEKLRVADQLPIDYDYWEKKNQHLLQHLNTSGKIAGVVRDEKGKPLPEVSVFINHGLTETKTNHWGQFEIDALPFGGYPLVFAATGYRTLSKVIPVVHSGATQVVVVMNVQTIDLSGFSVLPAGMSKKVLRALHPKYKRLRLSIENANQLYIKQEAETLRLASKVPIRLSSRQSGYRWLLYQEGAFINDNEWIGEIYSRLDTLPPRNKIEQNRWLRSRKQTYFASENFFLSSLLDGSLAEKGIRAVEKGKQKGIEMKPIAGDSLISMREGRFWLKRKNDLVVQFEKSTHYSRKSKSMTLSTRQNRVLLSTAGVYDPQELQFTHTHRSKLALTPMDYQLAHPSYTQLGQHAPIERVYLHTDRPYYYPGDTIWFKGTIVKNSMPSESKVLYVDLLNPQGILIYQLTLPVNEGGTLGDLPLSRDVPSGDYTLRAYTGYSVAVSQVFQKPLPILGVYEALPPDERDKGSHHVDVAVDLKTDLQQWNQPIQVTVALRENGEPIAGEFSVAITDQTLVGSLPNKTIMELDSPTNKYRRFVKIPEVEQGLMHHFNIRGGKPHETYDLVIVDQKNTSIATQRVIGNSGAFLLNFSDSTTVFIKCTDSRQNECVVEMIEQEFPQTRLPDPLLYQTTAVSLRRMNQSSDSTLMLEEMFINGKRIVTQTKAVLTTESIFGNVYQTLNDQQLLDIRQTKDLVEELHAKIPRLNNPANQFELTVDGVLETPSILRALSPAIISRVDVYPHPQNVVAIYTESVIPFQGKNPNRFSLKGFSQAHSFGSSSQGKARATVYWNPAVTVKSGVASITIPAATSAGTYKMVIEGTTATTKPFRLVEYINLSR